MKGNVEADDENGFDHLVKVARVDPGEVCAHSCHTSWSLRFSAAPGDRCDDARVDQPKRLELPVKPSETAIPDSMLASYLDGIETITLRRVGVPVALDGQVLVRVEAVGVCGSDVHYFDHGRIGEYVADAPIILGHEAAGVVVGVGANVSRGRLRERVAVEPQQPCRRCAHCKSGHYNLCSAIVFLATPPHDGAFTQYLRVDADFAHTIPDALSFEEAALCEPLSVAIWASRKAAIVAGSRVLITGAGPIGLITTQVARSFGAAEVIVSDPFQSRRDAALYYGATAVVDPASRDVAETADGVDVFIDASGSARAISSGIHALAPLGRAVLVGSGTTAADVPISRIQQRELQLTGVFRYANTWPLAIDMVARGVIDLASLVTARFSLDEVDSALRAGKQPVNVKSIVLPQRRTTRL